MVNEGFRDLALRVGAQDLFMVYALGFRVLEKPGQRRRFAYWGASTPKFFCVSV